MVMPVRLPQTSKLPQFQTGAMTLSQGQKKIGKEAEAQSLGENHG